jgi:chitosanase
VSDEDHLGLEKLQIATIDAIVGAFECARPFYYSRTARASGDAGGFSYGTHQVSHTSGNLHALLESYCNWTDPKPDPDFAARVRKRLKDVYVRPKPTGKAEIAKWEAEVEPKRVALLKDADLKSLVELCAQDPAMRRAQDAFFAARYLKPAIKQARAAGFTKALSVAVAFDSAIHSGPGWWDSHKDDVDKIAGPASNANETAWIEAYITYRRNWLVQRAEENPEKYGILKQTLYRPETFLSLAKATNWDLALPVKAHTYTITPWDDFPDDYFPDPVERAAGDTFGELGLSSAYDGRALFVQKSLKTLKFLNPSATADGIYGGQTKTAVEAFQEKQGLPRTGKVDAVTYERLCTQVKLALAERPDLSGGTPDGLRKMDEPPKGRPPYASGTLAAGVGAGTVALGMAAEGKDGATPSEAAIPAVTEAAKPVDAPAGAVVSTPAKTTATVGVPADSGQLSAPSSWSDPLLALGISVGFVLTVVLAAWFFRKTSHA